MSVPAAPEGQGCAEIARLSKDVLERPNICFVLNNTMKKMLPSGTSRQDLSDVPDDDSWWSLCLNRRDAASRGIHVTSTPIYYFSSQIVGVGNATLNIRRVANSSLPKTRLSRSRSLMLRRLLCKCPRPQRGESCQRATARLASLTRTLAITT